MSRPNLTLLQVVPRLDTGGVERTTLDISRAVVAAGGRSLVASAGGRLEAELEAGGGELIRLPVDSKSPLTMMCNARRLAQLCRDRGVDLIHVRSRAPAFSVWQAARQAGLPWVATYHGIYNARSPLKRWYNAVMTRGDAVIANSEFTRQHVIAAHGLAPERVVAIARGTDLERFSPDAVSRERVEALLNAWGLAGDPRPRALLAARLTRWKGQLLIVEALKRLADQGLNDLVVVMAGDDQGRRAYSDEIAAAVAEAGLEDRVRLVGHCADMPAAYLACDLALAPSLEPEAFGRTAVEPQAMARPVIAADHGAARETVVHGQTGLRATPGEAQVWAEALARMLALGPEGRTAMGEAGRARARALYSVQAMSEATLAVYAEVLNRRRA